MTSTWDGETTLDAFLGGRLELKQPRRGYRAGVDPVLLSAAVPAKPGHSILDLGCGVGAALLCLGARIPGLDLTGVEKQTAYADLARDNAARNGITARIATADLASLPDEIRQRRFDHVIANPPYFDRAKGTAATGLREDALGETLPLEVWVATGARRLMPRGRMSVIQKADRLPELMTAMASALGSLIIRPIQPRAGRDAALVIVQGRKEGRSPARLVAPFVMHAGADHSDDCQDYTQNAEDVLRYGKNLFGDCVNLPFSDRIEKFI